MELRRKDTCSLKRCREPSCKAWLCVTSASLLRGITRTIQKAIAFPIMIHECLYLNHCDSKYKFIFVGFTLLHIFSSKIPVL